MKSLSSFGMLLKCVRRAPPGAGSISQPAGCMARSARQPGSVVLCTSDDDDDTFDLPVVPAPAALHVGRPGVGVVEGEARHLLLGGMLLLDDVLE